MKTSTMARIHAIHARIIKNLSEYTTIRKYGKKIMKEKMNTVILTHPPGTNYGGIMQAYALQRVLSDQGLTVVTSTCHQTGLLEWTIIYLKYFIRCVIHIFKPSISNMPPHITKQRTVHTMKFVHQYIKTIPKSKLYSTAFLRTCCSFVVGSDQVLRQAYVPVEKYLLNFTKGMSVTRITYAASFGRDNLSEYSPRLVKKTARLARQFDAISIRESSGVNLANRYWGVSATQHVDPTLLLDKEHFEKLVMDDADNVYASPGNLFVYILDRDNTKAKAVIKTEKLLNLRAYELLPPTVNSYRVFKENIDLYRLPRVTQWLKSIMDAEFVITDSFHGCAFSIIFNKPFIAIGNKNRGIARFTSLLSTFGLQDRLISGLSELTEELLLSRIEWKNINHQLKNEQVRSISYLTEQLSESGCNQ